MQTFFLDVYIDTMASFGKHVRHLTYFTKYRVASPCIDRSSQADENIQENLQTKETGLWTIESKMAVIHLPRTRLTNIIKDSYENHDKALIRLNLCT